MDIVDLVVGLEEIFGVSFEDAECEDIETPRQLHEVLLNKLAERRTGVMVPVSEMSLAVLSRVIDFLRTEFDLQAGTVVGETPLEAVIPRRGRRRAWGRLSQRMISLGLDLPALKLDGAKTYIVAAVVFVLTIVTWLLLSRHFGYIASAVMAGCMTYPVGHLASWLLRPLKTEFPNDWKTVRDMAEGVMSTSIDIGLISVTNTRLPPNDVWLVLTYLIGRIVKMPPTAIDPDVSFVRDLGFD